MPHRSTLAALLLGIAGGLFGGRPACGQDAPPTTGADDEVLARIRALDDRAAALRRASQHDEAVPVAREALALRERAQGTDHPDVATSLVALAESLGALGAFAECRPTLERALAIREKTLGADHVRVAAILQTLADVHRLLGAYEDARRCAERALAIDERAYGPDHPTVASDLNSLAIVRRSQGAFDEARAGYLRALAIQERALGGEHPDVAMTLHNLARVLDVLGDHAEARLRFARAIAVCEKALGAEHPDLAGLLNNYGVSLRGQGAYEEAYAVARRALGIRERTLGKDHPDVAESLDAVAGLLRDLGSHAEARPLYDRALAIYMLRFGPDHPKVGSTLNNLAILLELQGDFAGAKVHYERAIAVWEEVGGPEHPFVAMILTNLSGIHLELGDPDGAQSALERALSIKAKTLGENHLSFALTLERLAGLLADRGAFLEARRHYERAIALLEPSLGADHPTLTIALNNYAMSLGSLGAHEEARVVLARALRGVEAHVRANLPALTSAQRLASLRTLRVVASHWVTLARRLGVPGYGEMFRVRGIVSRAEAAEREIARSAVGEDADLHAALLAATRHVGELANAVPARRGPAALASWQRQYALAAADRARLALEVSSKSGSVRAALERLDLTPEDVQRRLDARTALVDVMRVTDGYVGWILRATGEAVLVDLGPADLVDDACQAFVAAVVEDRGDASSARSLRDAGAALRALVWAPIEAALGRGVERLVVRPDAATAAIPFGALPGRAEGRFLLDEYALVHVMQAQDLVPRRDGGSAGGGAVVVGGVDYDRAVAGPAGVSLRGAEPGTGEVPVPGGRPFTGLPHTRAEAQGLQARLGAESTTLLLGADASEARVREAVKGRRLVHVATHGFAREDLLAGLYTRQLGEAFTSADVETRLAAGHDPMLLSGLALAGANPRQGGSGDDGILTALEASYLDLDGVDLVTLSACETAKGTAEAGEGVQGLVSAFQMAGARRVIASLWKVDDEATRRLMEGAYERMLRAADPRSPEDALRESALALRAFVDDAGRARFSSPRHWAAFVAYGR